jgi:transposase
MLKDSDNARDTARRTHRTYTPAFKAELIAACLQPGTSIAALASRHGMNASVLHRWLKGHARTGCHQSLEIHPGCAVEPALAAPAFIPLRLPAAMPEPVPPEIKVELRKSTLSMTVIWPIHAAAEL